MCVMKLCVLTEIISPYRIPVFNALAEHPDIDLQVIFLAETDPSMRQWKIYCDEARFSFEVLPSWRRRLGKHNLLINASVGTTLQRVCPDVILCGGYNYLASWQALRWAKKNHVAFLLWSESTAHDRRNRHAVVENLKQAFLDECSGFVVPGKSAFEYVSRMTGSENIFVAPNAVDNDLFSARSQAAEMRHTRLRGELGLPDRFCLYVGRLVRAKGVNDLLQAYAALDPEVREEVGLVFAGDGPLRAELEADARSIFPGSVHFSGFVDRDELPGYYALAECLVLPTYSDTWGMVVNEAMACGLPIVCSRVAGCAADLVGSNGILITPGEIAQLSAALHQISASSGLRSTMSAESRRLIQNYSPQCCARGIAKAALAVVSPRCSENIHRAPVSAAL
jgi:glycosyltransferase involved in cell wall biosynthesis